MATLIWFRCTSSRFLFHAWVSFWDGTHPERNCDADFNPTNQKYGNLEQLGQRWEVYGGAAATHEYKGIFGEWRATSPKPLTLDRMDILDPRDAAIAYAILKETVFRWSNRRYTAPLGFCLQVIDKGTWNGPPFDLESWTGNNCRTFAREVYETVRDGITHYRSKEGTNWAGDTVL